MSQKLTKDHLKACEILLKYIDNIYLLSESQYTKGVYLFTLYAKKTIFIKKEEFEELKKILRYRERKNND